MQMIKSTNSGKIFAILYFFYFSLRKISNFLSLFEKISYESVRIYYHRLKKEEKKVNSDR